MHSDRFPSFPHSTSPYRRGRWSQAELDPDLPSRRTWLIAIAGGLGGAIAALGVGWRLWSDRASAPVDEPAAPSDLPDWAREMLTLPPDRLLDLAGEFERQSWHHVGDVRLAPAFERLLEAVVASDHPWRDIAGGCAVRSLARLGRPDRVAAWQARLDARGLPQTASEVRRLVEEETKFGRRRRQEGR